MNGIELLYILLGGILGASCGCLYLLKRILNILRVWNNGEPTQADLNDIEFSKMKMKR